MSSPAVFVGLAFLGQIPGLIAELLTMSTTAGAIGMIPAAFQICLALAIQGAISYGVYEALRGNAAQLGSCLSRGLAHVFPLFFAVLSFIVFLVLIVIAPVALVYMLGALFGPYVFPIMVTLVSAFVMVAVSIMLCKWSVFVPVCVVERLGPINCLNRSSELTKGYRWKIYGLYSLCFLISFVAAFVLRLTAGLIGDSASSVISLIVGAVPIAFSQVMTAVVYYKLREVKEGVGIEHLVGVFD
jgi:hypothetical protein